MFRCNIYFFTLNCISAVEKKNSKEKFYPPTCCPKIPSTLTATLQTLTQYKSMNYCCVPAGSGKQHQWFWVVSQPVYRVGGSNETLKNSDNPHCCLKKQGAIAEAWTAITHWRRAPEQEVWKKHNRDHYLDPLPPMFLVSKNVSQLRRDLQNLEEVLKRSLHLFRKCSSLLLLIASFLNSTLVLICSSSLFL